MEQGSLIPDELSRVLNAWTKSLRLDRGVADSTVRQYVSTVRRVMLYMVKRGLEEPIHDMQPSDLLDYFDGIPPRAGTGAQPRRGEEERGKGFEIQRLTKVVLRAWYRWMNEMGFTSNNPTERFGKMKRVVYEPFVPSAREVEKLIRYWMPDGGLEGDVARYRGLRNAAIIVIMASAGLRRSEVAALKYGDLRKGDTHFSVRVVMSKGRRTRSVPFVSLEHEGRLSSNVISWWYRACADIGLESTDPLFPRLRHPSDLSEDRESHGISGDQIYALVREAARKTKVDPNLHPHSLRHFYGTVMYGQLRDLDALASLMGHDDVRVTRIYVHTNTSMSGSIAMDHDPLRGLSMPREGRGWARLAKSLPAVV